MTIEAPYSRHTKTNFKLLIVVCLIAAVVLAYDGYLSKYQWSLRRSFYEEHTNDGMPDGTMKFNQHVPFALLGISIIAALWYFRVKDLKVVADEKALVISEKETIPYSSIQQIDKTHFDSKGFFIITYKTQDGKQAARSLSYKRYDNLKAVLEHLVVKIT